MKKRLSITKKLVFNILRAAISAGLMAFLFWLMRGSVGEVFSAIKKIHKWTLLLSFLFCIFGFLLLSMRLKFIMAAQQLHIKFKDVVSLTFTGLFFSNFLPTSVGGDLAKAYYASRATGKKLPSVACVVFDRLLGTFTLMLMVMIAYIFVKEAPHNRSIITFLVIGGITSVSVSLILFSRRIAKRVPLLSPLLRKFKVEEKMKNLYTVIYNYKKHPALILNAIFMSFALQISMFYAVYLLTKGFNYSIPLKTVFLFMPIISTLSMAPSINGIGVRESAFVLLFGPVMSKEGAFALGILWFGLNFIISLMGGIIYLFDKQYRIKGGVELT